MKETRSLIGKTLLAMLALLVISFPFMSSASATYTPYTLPTATVFLSPPSISGTSGTTFTVNLNVTDITGVSTFGAGIMFDHHTTICTNVVQGTFMSRGGSTIPLSGTINNTIGIVGASSETEKGTNTASGSGLLVSWQFRMNGTGTSYSDLHIIYFEALDLAGNVIPCQVIDYFTASPGYIVKIVGNPQGEFGPPTYPSYTGFNYQNFATITGTYHGNMTFTIFAPDMTPPSPNDFGFVNVTIPNALMSGSWAAYVNGAGQTPLVTTVNSTHTMISLQFNYGSSTTANIQILSTVAVPEFASAFASVLLVAMLLLATLVAAVLTIKIRSKKREG